MKLLLIFLLSYLLGSFPTGYLTARQLGGIDIRRYGSGNTGATNVVRVLGVKAGLITAIGDVGKGFLTISIARSVFTESIIGLEPHTLILMCGLLAIVGHNWSIFLGFDGGKGVATTVGVLLNLSVYMIPLLIVIWVPLIYLTRYVSLASIVSGIAIPILMLIFGETGEHIFFGIIVAILIVYQHRSNIRRLLNGNENRFGSRKKGSNRRVR